MGALIGLHVTYIGPPVSKYQVQYGALDWTDFAVPFFTLTQQTIEDECATIYIDIRSMGVYRLLLKMFHHTIGRLRKWPQSLGGTT